MKIGPSLMASGKDGGCLMGEDPGSARPPEPRTSGTVSYSPVSYLGTVDYKVLSSTLLPPCNQMPRLPRVRRAQARASLATVASSPRYGTFVRRYIRTVPVYTRMYLRTYVPSHAS